MAIGQACNGLRSLPHSVGFGQHQREQRGTVRQRRQQRHRTFPVLLQNRRLHKQAHRRHILGHARDASVPSSEKEQPQGFIERAQQALAKMMEVHLPADYRTARGGPPLVEFAKAVLACGEHQGARHERAVSRDQLKLVARARHAADVHTQLDLHASVPRRLQQPAVEKTSTHAAPLEGQAHGQAGAAVLQAKAANRDGLPTCPGKIECVQAGDGFRRQKLATDFVCRFRVAFEQVTSHARTRERKRRHAPRGAATQNQHRVAVTQSAPSQIGNWPPVFVRPT
jgi:hypothetical protein